MFFLCLSQQILNIKYYVTVPKFCGIYLFILDFSSTQDDMKWGEAYSQSIDQNINLFWENLDKFYVSYFVSAFTSSPGL